VNAANKSHMLLVAITALCFVILISGIGEMPTNLPQIRQMEAQTDRKNGAGK
jgi:hypothetical protein